MAHEVLERPHQSSLDGCAIPSGVVLSDDMSVLGIKQKPYHLMVSEQYHPRNMDDVIRHVRAGYLPPLSLIQVRPGALVASPELTFYELALEHKRDSLRAYDDIDLAILGYELCGTYLTDEDEEAWSGFINTPRPLCTKASIARLLHYLDGSRNVRKASRALALVKDGSNSPMETVLAALLTFPQRLGGMGLKGHMLNFAVETSTGPRWIDVAFPACRVGVEYKGVEPHSLEKTGRDDRRQNKLHGSGWVIFNAWYEDVCNATLFNELAEDVARAVGVRIRTRNDNFSQRQQLLRSRLLPAFKRAGRAM